MPEDKRKINCWIPVSLYDRITTSGYENTTQAIIAALQKFLEDPQEDIEEYKQEIVGYKQDIKGYQKDIESYQKDIVGYKQDIESLTAENTQLKENLRGDQKDIEGFKKDMEKQNQDIIGYKQEIKALTVENEKLKEELIKAPGRGEFSQLCARSEELEKHNSTLKTELEKANQREEDLKNTYNNYFLQVQTLINQKAIEAPGNKKKWWKFW